MNKKMIFLKLPFGIILLFIIILASYFTFNDLRYVFWEKGWYELSPELASHYLNDPEKHESLLLGLTSDELEKRFVNIHTCKTASEYQKSECEFYYNICKSPPEYEKLNCKRFNRGKGIRWLGDTNYYVYFEKNVVVDIVKIKP